MADHRHRPVIGVAIASALGGAFFGYDTGIIASALLFARDDLSLGSLEQGVVVSAVAIGGIGGALLTAALSRRHVRRELLLLWAAIFAFSVLGAAVSANTTVLVAARLVCGVALGGIATVTPVYVVELAPPHARGRLVGIFQLAIVVGILVAAIAGLALAPSGSWRWMFALGAVPAVALIAIGSRLPQSPRWLLMTGRREEGRIALATTLSGVELERQLAQIQHEIDAQVDGRTLLRSRTMRRPAIVGFGLAAVQQLVGVSAIIFFTPTIVQFSGVDSVSTAILVAVGVGAVNLIATLAAMPLLDRVGRRTLLMTGLVVVTAALGGLALAFSLGEDSPVAPPLAVASLMVYIGAFAMSLGPIVWLVTAEIYPVGARGAGAALATIANRSSAFVVSLMFLPLVDLIGASASFLVFAAIGVGGLAFCWRLVPETRGLELESIQALFTPAVGEAPARR